MSDTVFFSLHYYMALELLLKWIILLFDVPERHIVAYLKCVGHMAAEALTMPPNRAV